MRSRGVAMLEFAMVFPIYLMGMLCFLQLVLIIHARFILNYAAFLAARAGIVYNARQEDMEWAARAAIAPNFARIQNGNAQFNMGMNRAQNEINNGHFSVQVLAPVNAHARMRVGATLTDTLGPDERNLHVRVSWNYPLMIPVANSLFSAFYNNVPTPNWPGFQPGLYLGGGVNPGNDPRIPIWAEYRLRIATLNPRAPYHAN